VAGLPQGIEHRVNRVKLVTEAALWGVPLNMGCLQLIILSDGAKQFAISGACSVLDPHGTGHSPITWGHSSATAGDFSSAG